MAPQCRVSPVVTGSPLGWVDSDCGKLVPTHIHLVASGSNKTIAYSRSPWGFSRWLHSYSATRLNWLEWFGMAVIVLLLSLFLVINSTSIVFCGTSWFQKWSCHRQKGLASPTQESLGGACAYSLSGCIAPVKESQKFWLMCLLALAEKPFHGFDCIFGFPVGWGVPGWGTWSTCYWLAIL